MQVMRFAASLEAQLRQEVEVVTVQAPAELQVLVAAMGRFQAEFELLIDRAQGTDVDTGRYPEVDAAALLGPDDVWRTGADAVATDRGDIVAGLASLWYLHTLTEKTGQFYHQAALNSAHPQTRLFFASLAEVKTMLRRRLDGALRALYNAAWAEVGFAPFMLGKD